MPLHSAGATLLAGTVPADLWAGLLMQNPRGVQDALAIELISRTYARPQARVGGTWQDCLFLGIPKGSNVAAVALFDAQINGTMRFSYVYATPYNFSKGGYLSVPAAALTVPVPAFS